MSQTTPYQTESITLPVMSAQVMETVTEPEFGVHFREWNATLDQGKHLM